MFSGNPRREKKKDAGGRLDRDQLVQRTLQEREERATAKRRVASATRIQALYRGHRGRKEARAVGREAFEALICQLGGHALASTTGKTTGSNSNNNTSSNSNSTAAAATTTTTTTTISSSSSSSRAESDSRAASDEGGGPPSALVLLKVVARLNRFFESSNEGDVLRLSRTADLVLSSLVQKADESNFSALAFEKSSSVAWLVEAKGLLRLTLKFLRQVSPPLSLVDEAGQLIPLFRLLMYVPDGGRLSLRAATKDPTRLAECLNVGGQLILHLVQEGLYELIREVLLRECPVVPSGRPTDSPFLPHMLLVIGLRTFVYPLARTQEAYVRFVSQLWSIPLLHSRLSAEILARVHSPSLWKGALSATAASGPALLAALPPPCTAVESSSFSVGGDERGGSGSGGEGGGGAGGGETAGPRRYLPTYLSSTMRRPLKRSYSQKNGSGFPDSKAGYDDDDDDDDDDNEYDDDDDSDGTRHRRGGRGGRGGSGRERASEREGQGGQEDDGGGTSSQGAFPTTHSRRGKRVSVVLPPPMILSGSSSPSISTSTSTGTSASGMGGALSASSAFPSSSAESPQASSVWLLGNLLAMGELYLSETDGEALVAYIKVLCSLHASTVELFAKTRSMISAQEAGAGAGAGGGGGVGVPVSPRMGGRRGDPSSPSAFPATASSSSSPSVGVSSLSPGAAGLTGGNGGGGGASLGGGGGGGGGVEDMVTTSTASTPALSSPALAALSSALLSTTTSTATTSAFPPSPSHSTTTPPPSTAGSKGSGSKSVESQGSGPVHPLLLAQLQTLCKRQFIHELLRVFRDPNSSSASPSPPLSSSSSSSTSSTPKASGGGKDEAGSSSRGGSGLGTRVGGGGGGGGGGGDELSFTSATRELLVEVCWLYSSIMAAWPSLSLSILTNMTFGTPLISSLWSLLKANTELEAFVDGNARAEERKSLTAILTFFFEVVNHLLSTLDDHEFFEDATYFSLPELTFLSSLLKRLVFRLHWHGPSSSFVWSRLSDQESQLKSSATALLKEIYRRNARRPFVPPEHWLVPALHDLDLETALEAYLDTFGAAESRLRVLLQAIPFFLPFEFRVDVFRGANDEDQGHLRFFHHAHVARVRRSSLVRDAFDQLHALGSQLRDRIQITFVNDQGLVEAGIDGGGVFKEFMTTFAKEAFSPEFGLFLATDEHTLYPNPHARYLVDQSTELMEFVGQMVGKALLEGILLEVPLAKFFLCKMLGRNNYLNDLPSLDPVLHKNLMKIKECSDVEALELTFTVADKLPIFDRPYEIELVPGGANMAVTHENKSKFIYLTADYKMNRQIDSQCRAFMKGLQDLVPVRFIQLFDQNELLTLIAGAETAVDVDDLRANCVYSNGYHENHPLILTFWAVVESFTEEQKRQLLKFVTSCSRAPLLGFKELQPKFCIHSAGNDQERLPTASTCMNLLKIPNYKDVRVLAEKLVYAIHSNSGFELS